MKTYLSAIFITVFLLSAFGINAQKTEENTVENTIIPAELKQLIGNWEGTLTYLDYSSGKPYSMPINLKAEQGKNENQLQIFYTYPKEPQANSKGKIMISKDGRKINGKKISLKENLSNDAFKFTTEGKGKDNKQKATIRISYYMSDVQFVMKKEVQFANSSKWITRNEYSFDRKK